MKKLLLLPFLLLAVLSMAACGGSDNEPFTPGQPETPEQPGGGDDTDDSDTLAPEGSGRYLVLYSSRTSNTTDPDGTRLRHDRGGTSNAL